MKIDIDDNVLKFIGHWLGMFAFLAVGGGFLFLVTWLFVAEHWIWGTALVMSFIATCFACCECAGDASLA